MQIEDLSEMRDQSLMCVHSCVRLENVIANRSQIQHSLESHATVPSPSFIRLLCSVKLASEELGLPPRMGTAELVELVLGWKVSLGALKRNMSARTGSIKSEDRWFITVIF